MTASCTHILTHSPGQSLLHGREEVEESVGHDDIVVDGHDKGDHAHRDAHALGGGVEGPDPGGAQVGVLGHGQLHQIQRLTHQQLQDQVGDEEGGWKDTVTPFDAISMSVQQSKGSFYFNFLFVNILPSPGGHENNTAEPEADNRGLDHTVTIS